MTAATHAPVTRQQALVHDVLRVSGRLTGDARLVPTQGQPPHTLLIVDFKPAEGFAYHARVDLGDDLFDRMDAEALLPALRAGAYVSVAGRALRLRHDHGHAVLDVLGARAITLFQHPITAPITAPIPTGAAHADA